MGLTNLSDFTNANLLSGMSMNNQECKTRPQVVNVNGVVVVIILTIHMQKFVLLIL